MQREIILTKVFETDFSHNKDAKATWLACQGFSYEENLGAIPAAEVNTREALVRQSGECTFYGKLAVEFFLQEINIFWVVWRCEILLDGQ